MFSPKDSLVTAEHCKSQALDPIGQGKARFKGKQRTQEEERCNSGSTKLPRVFFPFWLGFIESRTRVLVLGPLGASANGLHTVIGGGRTGQCSTLTMTPFLPNSDDSWSKGDLTSQRNGVWKVSMCKAGGKGCRYEQQ